MRVKSSLIVECICKLPCCQPGLLCLISFDQGLAKLSCLSGMYLSCLRNAFAVILNCSVWPNTTRNVHIPDYSASDMDEGHFMLLPIGHLFYHDAR